jgi:hypothetical protein
MKRQKKTYVIVRCTQAGVHAGEFERMKGTEVVLTNARRLWRWWSAFTLSELAMEGPRADKISENRYSVPVGRITLTEACEVIECSEKGEAGIRSVPNANT